MIYSRLGNLDCNVVAALIGRMTGGANDLHVIMCYKTVGIDYMRTLRSNIQYKTRLNNVTISIIPISPPPPPPSNKPPLESTLNK